MARQRFSYVVTRDGSVIQKMELYDGQNWVSQMGKVVAESVAEFRRRFPGKQVKHRQVEQVVEEQDDFMDLLEVRVADLSDRLPEVDKIDALIQLIEVDDRETARRLYRQRAAELYRERMNPEANDGDTDEGETGEASGSDSQGA